MANGKETVLYIVLPSTFNATPKHLTVSISMMMLFMFRVYSKLFDAAVVVCALQTYLSLQLKDGLKID